MSSKKARNVIQHFEMLTADFKKRSKRVLENADPEEVHLLRRTVRRLRSLLWVIRHGADVKVGAKLRDDLRDWGRALGARREADVLIRDSKEFYLHEDRFEGEQSKADLGLHEVITQKSRRKLLDRLRRVEHRLRRHPEIDEGQVMADAYERYFPVLDDGQWPPPKQLHEMRIDAKKMRYVLEAFDRPADPLHQFESALGHVHDLEVLKEKLGE